jgi:hypothetical protein
VLRHSSRRLADHFGKRVDRQLTVPQRQHNPNPGRIRKHLEDLHGQLHPLVVSMIDSVNRISLQIRMYMQIIAQSRKRQTSLAILRRLSPAGSGVGPTAHRVVDDQGLGVVGSILISEVGRVIGHRQTIRSGLEEVTPKSAADDCAPPDKHNMRAAARLGLSDVDPVKRRSARQMSGTPTRLGRSQ